MKTILIFWILSGYGARPVAIPFDNLPACANAIVAIRRAAGDVESKLIRAVCVPAGLPAPGVNPNQKPAMVQM